MPTLQKVLEDLGDCVLLREEQTGVIRTVSGWRKEEALLDPGQYMREIHDGGSWIVQTVGGVPIGEPAYREVHTQSLVHEVIGRLEPPLQEAFAQCIPLAMEEAEAERKRAAHYLPGLGREEVEEFALCALFSYACSWRAEPERLTPQVMTAALLWTPELRSWIRKAIQEGLRKRQAKQLEALRIELEICRSATRHSENQLQGARALLEQLDSAVRHGDHSKIQRIAERSTHLLTQQPS